MEYLIKLLVEVEFPLGPIAINDSYRRGVCLPLFRDVVVIVNVIEMRKN